MLQGANMDRCKFTDLVNLKGRRSPALGLSGTQGGELGVAVGEEIEGQRIVGMHLFVLLFDLYNDTIYVNEYHRN